VQARLNLRFAIDVRATKNTLMAGGARRAVPLRARSVAWAWDGRQAKRAKRNERFVLTVQYSGTVLSIWDSWALLVELSTILQVTEQALECQQPLASVATVVRRHGSGDSC